MVEECRKGVSREERLRTDSGFSYLIREVEQLFKQLSVASSIGQVRVAGCEAENLDVGEVI